MRVMRRKRSGSQAVQADVDTSDARRSDWGGQFREPGAVGGDYELVEPGQGGDLAHEPQDVAAHQGLTAGKANLVYVEAHEGPGYLCDFLETEQLGAGGEVLVRLHAVDATEIAPVGDRDPKIGDPAAEAVDQGGWCGVCDLSSHRESRPHFLMLLTDSRSPPLCQAGSVGRRTKNSTQAITNGAGDA